MRVEYVSSVGVGNTLGEGVLWNERRGTVWWTDIEHRSLFEYDPESDSIKTWETPYRVGCFGFVEMDDTLVVAFDAGVALYDVDSGRVDWLVEPGVLSPGIRFNDGKIDALGRLWVGTMVENPLLTSESGALYSLDPGAGLIECVSGVAISNGLCWKPDNTMMYHADSRANAICAYRFDVLTGAVSNRTTFATTERGVVPDGATVDAEGGLWSAQWGGAAG